MIKKLLITFMISILSVLNGFAQDASVDLYRAGTNVLTHIWSNGGFVANPANTTTAGLPVYEGAEHFLFDYSGTGITNWSAQGQFTISNWGANLKNFSNLTHIVIAYKASSSASGNKLNFRLMDNSNVYGPYVSVATNTATYKVDTIPLSLFKGTSALNFATIKELGFQITSGVQNFTGSIYIDNIRVIDLVNVKAGAANIQPYGSFNFGSANSGTTTASTTFTIENYGAQNLGLTASPKIDISGTNSSEFTITQASIISPITGAGSTTFNVTFNPSSVGSKTAAISIANQYGSYATSGSYVINLTGTGTVPEINLKQAATSIASSGSFDFGNANVGSPTAATTFTIENSGTGPLTLSGSPRISLSGTNSADFSIDSTALSAPVMASGTTSFTITFNPSSTGARSATVTIANNDSDEGSYVVNLTGTGTVPEIDVKENSLSIASGGSFDFGSSNVGTATAATTFTIENSGTGPLALSGTPRIVISGANASDFTIDSTALSAPLAAAGSTTFTISFNPSDAGARSAYIAIVSNDSDESNYLIDLTGTGIGPEINVKAGSMSIASAGSFDFGSSIVGIAASSVTFTIENSGTADLTLSGSPAVSISGTNFADFAITQTSVVSPVTASGSTSFTITFTPSATGSRTAAISIGNDDSNEGTYVINLTGTGTPVPVPEINVKAGSTSIASAGSFDFGSSDVGTATSAITFTIENSGTAGLNLSGTPRIAISGANASDFTIDSTALSAPIAASGTTSFTITFNPSASGSRAAAITISNDDSDEGTYVINLTGTGNAITGLSYSNAGTDSYTAYPSPFQEETSVRINSSIDVPVSIKMTDTKGTTVYASEAYFTNQEITLGKGLPQGVYTVQATYGNKMQLIRIVKI
jgi:hypothetical protein